MPRFSRTSIAQLGTCHGELQRLFGAIVKDFDCAILCGYRGKAEQDRLYHRGLTRVKYPGSKHNRRPSLAVDVAPFPIDWEDIERFYYFAGVVIGTARAMGIDVRWGGDWDGDTQVQDNRFDDLPHFELVE